MINLNPNQDVPVKPNDGSLNSGEHLTMKRSLVKIFFRSMFKKKMHRFKGFYFIALIQPSPSGKKQKDK